MVRKKEYEKALDRFNWFFNHVEEKCSSMSPVKVSFALSYWMELAEVYPAALTAMKRTRDSINYLFTLGSGTYNSFKDLKALNDHLGDTIKSLEVFENLDKNNPQLAKESWMYARDILFDFKKYDLLKKYMDDPYTDYTRWADMYKWNMKDKNKIPVEDSVDNEFFVRDCVRLITYCNHIGDKVTAKKIQRDALNLLDDKRIREAM
jgi:hypothetical protein